MGFYSLTLLVKVSTITSYQGFAVAFPHKQVQPHTFFQIPPPGNWGHHQAMMVMSLPFLRFLQPLHLVHTIFPAGRTHLPDHSPSPAVT